jgi:hypothetical protein
VSEFFRQFWIAQFSTVEIDHIDALAVFNRAVAQVMQLRLPLPVVLQIVGDMSRKKNVSRISAVHHPLCDVNSSTCDIYSIINVSNLVYWSTVNTHPQFQRRVVF